MHTNTTSHRHKHARGLDTRLRRPLTDLRRARRRAGHEPDRASLEEIRAALPQVELWVDAGFAAEPSIERFLRDGYGRPVLGSESQRDAELVLRFSDQAVLSLDTRGRDRLGPAELHERTETWPNDLIVMSLVRIGVDEGPDLAAVAAYIDSVRPVCMRDFYVVAPTLVPVRPSATSSRPPCPA